MSRHTTINVDFHLVGVVRGHPGVVIAPTRGDAASLACLCRLVRDLFHEHLGLRAAKMRAQQTVALEGGARLVLTPGGFEAGWLILRDAHVDGQEVSLDLEPLLALARTLGPGQEARITIITALDGERLAA